ncbi:SDR family oxidoreductase [Hoyosella rhizosphaerae]|uniref:Short-chain dehydrogenase n=1 Tax=Hoyosella rhizosphaerae TaxID=1755582 RepID=A0A916TZX9_9ACTN|nr:SDR family oxidoreductase [Hoyosella rhizosphaerae]MBN4927254.1 SDR family oxidoreductase [Hoyosella rhizosphaerae]GGC52734.1 short-chain dehydrogenase [Hoyosella rhizosphaerae]
MSNEFITDLDLRDKVVFVAGGTSGINLGIAEDFARAGAHVAVQSRSQDKVDSTVASLRELGVRAWGGAADVRDYAATEKVLADAHAELGDFDVLISGAAGNFPVSALKMSANAFKSVVDIDLLGTFNVLRAGYQFLRKPGGCVINISAPQSELPTITQAHVCAAKAGVDMLTRTLALEWGPAGVRVNAVIPGPIDGTEGMSRLAPTEESRSLVTNSVPLRRYGTPRDVANVCRFLASPLADYVTGVILPADGGWVLGGASHAMGVIGQPLLDQ